jgi:hypothetical protein
MQDEMKGKGQRFSSSPEGDKFHSMISQYRELGKIIVKPAAAIDPNTMFLANSFSSQKHPVLAGSHQMVSVIDEIGRNQGVTPTLPSLRPGKIVAEALECVNFDSSKEKK